MGVMPKGSKQFSSREFNQKTGEAKQAAKLAPVFITDRGQASHVLLSIEEYERLSKSVPEAQGLSLAEALGQKGAPDFDIELPPRLDTLRVPDLS